MLVGTDSRRAESLRVLLRALHDVDHVGQAESLTTAWQAIIELSPGVVLIDVGMPGEQGLALLERLAAERPGIGRIALVSTDAQAQAARAAGATSVVWIPTTLDRLANEIRATPAPREAAT